MVWDKDLPLGSKAGNLLDDDIRDNNAALETALTEEHVFDSGGTQTGKHTFAVETEATRGGDSDYATGSVSITTDTVSGQYVFTFTYDGTNWVTPIEAFLNNANDWVLGQYHTPVTLTSGANIASDWTNANIFHLSLAHNGQLDNPDNIPSTGKSGVWFYIVSQSDASGWSLTYDTRFFGPNGGASSTGPALTSGAGEVDVLMCTLRVSGGIDICNLSAQGAASTTGVGLVELATDAEAAAMNATDVVITPSNMSSTDMGTGTGASGWSYLFGHSSAYGQFVIQWVTLTTDANPDTVTWPVAFASSTYSVIPGPSVGCGTYVNWSGRTTTTVAIEVQGGSGQVVSIVGIGPIADI